MLGTARKVWRRTRRLFRHDPPHHRALSENLRTQIARRYLRGKGMEVGALHNPLVVPAGATVRYVDRMDVDQLRFHYPELASCALVPSRPKDRARAEKCFRAGYIFGQRLWRQGAYVACKSAGLGYIKRAVRRRTGSARTRPPRPSTARPPATGRGAGRYPGRRVALTVGSGAP